MPKYEYRCAMCNATQEVEKPMGSDWIPICCNMMMERVWFAPAIKFNGPGFYKTGG